MAIKMNKNMQALLKQQAIDRYVIRLVMYCQTKYTNLTQRITTEKLNEIIHHCIGIAAKRGFTQQDTTRFYIDLMILFGVEFENDPQYGWVRKIFSDYNRFGELTKSEMLYFEVITFLDKAYGENLSNKAEVFSLLENYIHQQLAIPYSIDNKKDINEYELQQYIIDGVLQVAPAKYHATKEEDFDALVTFGMKRAREHLRFEHPLEIKMAVILMFVLGSHFDEDPFLINVEESAIETIEMSTFKEKQTVVIKTHSYKFYYQHFYSCFPWLESLIQISRRQLLVN